MTVDDQTSTARKPPRRMPRMFSRFRRSSDGSAAIEFALLALPFFVLIFATIEAFIAFAGEQLLENAVDTMARQVRTGQAKNFDEEEFRTKFCAEISLMISCAEEDSKAEQRAIFGSGFVRFRLQPRRSGKHQYRPGLLPLGSDDGPCQTFHHQYSQGRRDTARLSDGGNGRFSQRDFP